MFFQGKEGLVNLDHVFFVKKDFMLREKKYVILFQFNPEMGYGYMSWKYDTEEEREKEFLRLEEFIVFAQNSKK